MLGVKIVADQNRRAFGDNGKTQSVSRAERKQTRMEAHARASYKQKIVSSRVNDLMQDLEDLDYNLAIG